MNTIFSRTMSVFLSFVLVFGLIGTYAFAANETDEGTEETNIGENKIELDEENQTFTMPGDDTEYTYWVNPDIDEFLISDMTDQIQEYSDQISTLSVKVDDADSAVAELKRELINRQSPIVITYSKGSSSYSSAEDLYLQATKHTGVKDEGDYIQHNISNYCCTTDNSGAGTITVTYFIRYYTTAEEESTTTKEATALLEQLGVFDLDKDDDYDRYQIVKKIYDWVCDNVSYDDERVAEMEADHRTYVQQTAYGALVNREASCSGYANLMYRLLLESGIDNRIVRGTSSSASHAWNLVDMYPEYDNSWSTGTYDLEDGLWYYLDSTWDAGCDEYTYFLCGSTNFNQSHDKYSFSNNIDNYEISYSDYDAWYYSYLYEPERGYSFRWDDTYQDCRVDTSSLTYRCTVSQTGAGQYTGRTITLTYNSGYNDGNGYYGNLTNTVKEQIEQLQELGYFPRHTILLGGYMPTDDTVRSMVSGGWRWYDDLSLKTYTLDEFFATGVDMIFYSSDYVGKSDYEFTWDQLAYFESEGITCIDIGSLITDDNAWSYLYSFYDMSVIDSNKAGFFFYEGFWVALLYHQYVNDIPQSVLDDLGINWIISNTVCNHSYGDPTWHWGEDGETCRASFTCKYCGYETTVDAMIFQTGTYKQVTCTEDGSMTCVAAAYIPGSDYVLCSSGTVATTQKAKGHPADSLKMDLYTTEYMITRDTDGNYYYEPVYFEFVCGECGERIKVTPTLENWYYTVIETTQPTCTATGSMTLNLCVDLHENVNSVKQYFDETITVQIPANEHLHSTTSFTWSSDYSSCQVNYQCDRCMSIYETHACTITTSIIEATCSSTGRITYTAAYYDDVENKAYTTSTYVTLPKTEHSYSTSTLSASFDATEGVAYISMYCADCDEEDIVDAPVTYSVSYDDSGVGIMVLSATIEINGESVTVQSDEYDPDIETAHEWVLTDGSDPTCTAGSEKTYTCSHCFDTMTETYSALGHAWDNGTVTQSATCVNTGIMTYTCTRDGCSETKTESIAATGVHTYGEWATTDEPGCTTTGTETRVCTVCGDTQTNTLEATGHTPATDKAVDPTCTETGLTEGSHCSTCNAVLEPQVVIPELGHSWNNGEITQQPTCVNTGIKTYTCTRDNCNETMTESVSATGHTVVVDSAVDPTCTETGLTEGSHCSVCNEVLIAQEIIPANGHNLTCDFDWNNDGSKCTAHVYCSEDDVNEYIDCDLELIYFENADCVNAGYYVVLAECEYNGETYTSYMEFNIDETGHSPVLGNHTWNEDHTAVTEEVVCADCGELLYKFDISAEEPYVEDSTCTEDGIELWYADFEFDGENITEYEYETIDALGHEWGEPVFTWSDDHSECTATFECVRGCIETVDCDVTVDENDDSIVYTATVDFDGSTYIDEVTVDKEGDAIVTEPDGGDNQSGDNDSNDTSPVEQEEPSAVTANNTETEEQAKSETVTADQATVSVFDSSAVVNNATDSGTTTVESPKTGNTDILFVCFLIMIAISGGCLALTVRKRKRI